MVQEAKKFSTNRNTAFSDVRDFHIKWSWGTEVLYASASAPVSGKCPSASLSNGDFGPENLGSSSCNFRH